jgi:hypothetical protein
MSQDNIVLRPATSADIPSLATMVLTSFRRFPLFDLMYTPIRSDISLSRITLFYWNLRLRKALLDPSAIVVIAELQSPAQLPNQPIDKPETAEDEESWTMLKWIQTQPRYILPRGDGNEVVGFALWRWEGEAAQQNKRSMSMWNRIERLFPTPKH